MALWKGQQEKERKIGKGEKWDRWQSVVYWLGWGGVCEDWFAMQVRMRWGSVVSWTDENGVRKPGLLTGWDRVRKRVVSWNEKGGRKLWFTGQMGNEVSEKKFLWENAKEGIFFFWKGKGDDIMEGIEGVCLTGAGGRVSRNCGLFWGRNVVYCPSIVIEEHSLQGLGKGSKGIWFTVRRLCL